MHAIALAVLVRRSDTSERSSGFCESFSVCCVLNRDGTRFTGSTTSPLPGRNRAPAGVTGPDFRLFGRSRSRKVYVRRVLATRQLTCSEESSKLP